MKQTLAKTMIILTVIFMDLLAGMEFDLFVPSFPELQNLYSLSPFWVEALLSVNFAGYCISLFFVGGLADRYGRKPIILLGLITFVIGSLFCLYAAAYSLLLVGRFLQGVGIAAPAILSFLIIADSYALKQQQYLMTMLNVSLNTAAAIAPVIGSYITLYFHWQGNFIALLFLGLIALIMTLIFVPTHPLPEPKQTLSWRGYLPIFQSKPLMLLIIHILIMLIPYWVFVGMSPLLYMQGLGVSLSYFGIYQGVLALTFALGCLLFGMIMHHYDQKKMLYVSIQLLIISLICITLVTSFAARNPLFITFALLTFVLSQVIPGNLLGPVSLNFIPEAKARVLAITQGGRLIFAALGLQVAGYFYQGSFLSIGVIIISLIVMGTITLFWIIRNRPLMNMLYP
jgi:DHA1 family bicyclomycin/chloramphenicol resistance-like MFS transporter